MRCQTFSFSFFPCSADHERDWPPCKVVFFGLATNALNVRNNNNNNCTLTLIAMQGDQKNSENKNIVIQYIIKHGSQGPVLRVPYTQYQV